MSIDLEQRRADLLTLRENVLASAHGLAHGDIQEGELSTAADDHLADHASDMVDREVDGTLELNAEHLVAEIDAALARIADGSYGTCEGCSTTIPAERLEAVPYATMCVSCKRDEERR